MAEKRRERGHVYPVYLDDSVIDDHVATDHEVVVYTWSFLDVYSTDSFNCIYITCNS